MNNKVECRRVEWRRGYLMARLVDLESGQTIARWFEDIDGKFTARTFNPTTDTTHATAEDAERWCMEQI